MDSFVYGELLITRMKYTSRISAKFVIHNGFVFESKG